MVKLITQELLQLQMVVILRRTICSAYKLFYALRIMEMRQIVYSLPK